MQSPDLQQLLQEHANELESNTEPVFYEELNGPSTLSPPAPRRRDYRWLAAVAAAAVVLVLIGGVSLLFGDDTEPLDPAGSPIVSTPTTAAEPPGSSAPATVEPAIESTMTEATNTQLPAAANALLLVNPPGPLADDAEPWVRSLHDAATSLAVDTNALGEAFLALDDFSEGWEDQEPFGGGNFADSILGQIDIHLVEIREVAESTLEANGYVRDEVYCRWRPSDSTSFEAVEFAQLAELDSIPCNMQTLGIADLFSTRSKTDAIECWNTGMSPYRYASRIIELVDSIAGTTIESEAYSIAHDHSLIHPDEPRGGLEGFTLIGTETINNNETLNVYQRSGAPTESMQLLVTLEAGPGSFVIDTLLVYPGVSGVSLSISCSGSHPIILTDASEQALRAWIVTDDLYMTEIGISDLTSEEKSNICHTTRT